MPATDPQLTQLVEILAGQGRGARGQAAVRFDDLAGMVDLPDTLTSDFAAGAAPTAAEHDALVTDVHTIFRHLRSVSASIQKKRNLR